MTRYEGPTLLEAEHVLNGFDSGDDELNRWLVDRAGRNQAGGASRTWVVTDGDRVVAFYASSTAVVLRTQAPGKVSRNQPDPVPALLLARLAVDIKHQRRGLGEALLKHFLVKALEVAALIGVRVVLVHAATDAAAAWYLRYGFERSPVDDRTLMMLIKDIEQGT